MQSSDDAKPLDINENKKRNHSKKMEKFRSSPSTSWLEHRLLNRKGSSVRTIPLDTDYIGDNYFIVYTAMCCSRFYRASTVFAPFLSPRARLRFSFLREGPLRFFSSRMGKGGGG